MYACTVHTDAGPLQLVWSLHAHSWQAWVAHVLIVLFAAFPEVVCHGFLDSSLGKLSYTSHSAVSLNTVYT